MKQILFIVAVLMAIQNVKGQFIYATEEAHIPESFDNIYMEKIFSDDLVSSFLIVIKEKVPLHKHEHHSEHVYVIEGSGEMKLGDKNVKVSKGDVIVIPKGTPHSLKVTSRDAMQIISVQAPKYEGKDRVLIE